MPSLEYLLSGLSIKESLGPIDLPISKLCFESRQATWQSCFFAIPGTQTDGHQYIAMAIASGSHIIVCQTLPPPSEIAPHVTYIVVESSSIALGRMAANWYGHPSRKIQIVAITGTNGKTTTVHLLYQMMMNMGHKAGMISTIFNKVAEQTYPSTHTTPDVVALNELLHLMVMAGCRYCFMEASSHAIVQQRLSGITLSGAVFTNITAEHLDYHLNFLNYIWAKKKVFDGLSGEAFALLNKDDKHYTNMVEHCQAQSYTFSLEQVADFKAKLLGNTLAGLELEVDGQSVAMQLLGKFNASNCLAAYAVGQILGCDAIQSLVALSKITPILGRMNVISHANRPMVLIDYAHTPDAVKQVMDNLQSMGAQGGRLITIMGCGGHRDRQNRAQMGRILARYSDMAIFTSDNPRYESVEGIIQDMQKGVPEFAQHRVVHILNRAMAIKTACVLAQPKDLIVILGKGHQRYEDIQGTKHPFNEPKMVQDILKSL